MHYLHSAPDIEVIEEVISWVGQKVHETIVLVDGSMLNDDERAIFELAGFSRLWQLRAYIFRYRRIGTAFYSCRTPIFG